MTDFNRRHFMKASLATAALGVLANTTACSQTNSKPPKALGKSVMGLVVPAMPLVRIGLIGVGERGVGYIGHF
ncbi:MAG: twin-arginine translocation signal domain-containing protein, partial [Gammaproteobacteria bacterium]|nr:twin-arginine translocation signal domain-containing protein [Gammaproteobacteria bacterium]